MAALAFAAAAAYTLGPGLKTSLTFFAGDREDDLADSNRQEEAGSKEEGEFGQQSKPNECCGSREEGGVGEDRGVDAKLT